MVQEEPGGGRKIQEAQDKDNVSRWGWPVILLDSSFLLGPLGPQSLYSAPQPRHIIMRPARSLMLGFNNVS